jgi:hypothetical protein
VAVAGPGGIVRRTVSLNALRLAKA